MNQFPDVIIMLLAWLMIMLGIGLLLCMLVVVGMP